MQPHEQKFRGQKSVIFVGKGCFEPVGVAVKGQTGWDSDHIVENFD